MLALLLAALGCGAVRQDTATARAESLLAVGRAHFARPVIGRYAALDAFRAAARLSPTDPEPLCWQMKVGFYLGSDEGDVLAREAILRILVLDPDYADVWERFGTLYRNPKIWRRADRALARHPDNVVAMARRAELAIALDEPRRADSLLAEVLRRRGGAPHVPAYLARAEANFNAGRDSAGYAWYDSALAYADLDSTGAMWDAVWMIATPEESRAQDSTAPGERRRFVERFWATRDPNLLTAGNERIAEHFRRFSYARRYFRLLHPMNLYQRSARYRALIAATQRDFLEARAKQQADPYPGAASDRLLAASRQLPDVRAGDATSSALAGLDARGLIYIRHGPPDALLRGYFDPLNPLGAPESPLDIEGWLYHTPGGGGGTLSIGFRRASGSLIAELGGGDFIFLPTNRRQAASTRVALETDRSTLPAPLATRTWSAFFKSAELGLTDVYYKAQGDSAAVVLWDANDEPVRASGPGLLQVTVPPGGYALGLDVVGGGVLGRARRGTIVPRFSLVDLGLSSLALAPASSLLDRDAALRGMPADLVYPAATPLAAYVEVYGLTADPSGRAQYRVRYEFEPVRSLTARLFRGARPVVFEFDRSVAASATAERLVIDPDKLPAGRYRVTVVVTDLQRNVKSESAALEVTVR
jgi:hypothetical protein